MRFLTAAFLSLIVATPAMAQNNDMRSLMGRLDQMQRQMDTISRQVYSGQTPPPGAVSTGATPDNAGLAAAMDERMAGIEASVRQLTGRLDEQDYALGQLKQQFDMFKSDVEIQLREISARSTAAAQTAAPAVAPATTDTATTTATTDTAAGAIEDLPADSAAAMYDGAFQALREQKYDRAEKAFQEFLKRYSDDALAGNALYWLGETYYVRANYKEASKVFAQGYKKYPKSSKAPDNLLKLGLSMAQNDQKKEACVILQQLKVQYPNAAAVILQRAQDERKKLECVGAE